MSSSNDLTATLAECGRLAADGRPESAKAALMLAKSSRAFRAAFLCEQGTLPVEQDAAKDLMDGLQKQAAPGRYLGPASSGRVSLKSTPRQQDPIWKGDVLREVEPRDLSRAQSDLLD